MYESVYITNVLTEFRWLSMRSSYRLTSGNQYPGLIASYFLYISLHIMIVKPTDYWVNVLVKQFPLHLLSVIKTDIYPFWFTLISSRRRVSKRKLIRQFRLINVNFIQKEFMEIGHSLLHLGEIPHFQSLLFL